MNTSIRRGAGAALAFLCVAFGAGCWAQTYPGRPLQIVVPFAAGGGLDLNARNLAQGMAESLKEAIAVSNRDGAAGTIGLQSVATARPDGYTLAFTPAVPLSSEPHRIKVGYNLDSFRYVCQVFDNIFAIAVTKDSPYRTLADVLADARRDAGRVNYGTSGTGSIPHLGTSDIEATAKVQMTHVPYKGDAPMLQDLLSHRLSFGVVLASSIVSHLDAGTLRLIAVYSDKRHPAFPSVPTLTEAGVPVVQASFGGLLVPAATPDAVVAVLETACQAAVTSPKYVDWARRVNQLIDYRPGKAFEQRMREDSRLKSATIQRLGLQEAR